MADRSKIEWTNATWNVITGCSVVSPGCTNCYAMRLAGTRLKHHPTRKGLTTASKAGPVWNGQVRFNEEVLAQPLRWQKPRRIFVVAHGDLFHEAVPDEKIAKVMAVCALARRHIMQILTKRSARMAELLLDPVFGDWIFQAAFDIAAAFYGREAAEEWASHKMPWPLPNVQLGFSAENQKWLEIRRHDMADLSIAGWKIWLSAEPLLGPIDFEGCWIEYADPRMHINFLEQLAWVVVGGESKQNKPGRPMHPDWVRLLRDQCQAVDTPFFFKQWGEWAPEEEVGDDEPIRRACSHSATAANAHRVKMLGDEKMLRVGKGAAGRILDGRTWDEMPRDDR